MRGSSLALVTSDEASDELRSCSSSPLKKKREEKNGLSEAAAELLAIAQAIEVTGAVFFAYF